MPWQVCRQYAHESIVAHMLRQNPGASASRERKKGESGSARKAGESGRSSLSKSAKSKVCREQFNQLLIIISLVSRKLSRTLPPQLNPRHPPREVKRS